MVWRRVQANRRTLRKRRPLPRDVVARLREQLRIAHTYHSNAIEGNTLTLKETREVLPQIIEFSELGDFIDQPMRTYSSGMYVRLGFAVAVHTQPEILLVDEVLAVGDVEFQRKCLSHIEKLRAKNVTIVFVSHDLMTVARFCDRVILMDHGRISFEGDAGAVIHEYLSRIARLEAAMAAARS